MELLISSSILLIMGIVRMDKPELNALLKKIKETKPYKFEDDWMVISQTFTVLPRLVWEPELLEVSLNCALPDELRYFWDLTSGVVLFEDVVYGQWGLVIWSSDQAFIRHQRYSGRRPDEFIAGDLIIGEFLGDSDLIVLRCDPNKADFGTVVIALPITKRETWYRLNMSLGDFLSQFMQKDGKKFWETVPQR